MKKYDTSKWCSFRHYPWGSLQKYPENTIRHDAQEMDISTATRKRILTKDFLYQQIVHINKSLLIEHRKVIIDFLNWIILLASIIGTAAVFES